MSSLSKMLAIFDEFSADTPTLTAEEIATRLGYSMGTAYRYLRELTAAGLLTGVGGAYALGPRIIEMDFLIRQSDPYMRIIQPIMRGLRNRLDCDVLMCNFYQGRIVVSHHERGSEQFTMSYGRGRRMPLLRGSPSKSILATLPKSKLRRLFDQEAGKADASDLDWDSFYTEIKSIRRRGFALSKGELDPGNVGVAAALNIDPPGCLVFVFSGSRFEIADEKLVGEIICSAVEQANALIARLEKGESHIDWFNDENLSA